MIDVIVQRENPLPYRAPDIVDPLLTTEEAAVARGRDYLAEEGSGMQPVQFVLPFQKGVRAGQIVKVRDSVLGVDIKGKVVSIEHRVTKEGGDEGGSGEGALHVMTFLTVKTPTSFDVISTR